MTGGGRLERRYRRLLGWYPASHRRTFGEEMIGVLLAAAPEGRSRPGLAGTADLILGGLRARFRSGFRRLADINWSDALAVCSVSVPVMLPALAALLLAGWWDGFWGVLCGLGGLAIAAIPPLLALRLRRTAALGVLVLAG